MQFACLIKYDMEIVGIFRFQSEQTLLLLNSMHLKIHAIFGS